MLPNCVTSASMEFNTAVFFDLETTGLQRNCRITEVSMVSIQRSSFIPQLKWPRVMNKILLTVNPGKAIHPEAFRITGLSNEELECFPKFSQCASKQVAQFLSNLPKPICLLAHNGTRFDFPILKRELEESGIDAELFQSWLCCDTLPLFKKLAYEGLLSFVHEETPKKIINNQYEIAGANPDVPISVRRNLFSENERSSETTPAPTQTQEVHSATFLHRDYMHKSFSLLHLYEHICGRSLLGAHSAEVDTLALVECVLDRRIVKHTLQYIDDTVGLFHQVGTYK